MQKGVRLIPSIKVRSTAPEAGLHAHQQYLLDALANSVGGINIRRVESFFLSRGLRIAPYKLLNEADTRLAEKMGELDGLNGSYKASHDVALVPRHAGLEAINGSELTESILVHELAHGINEYHDLVYLQDEVGGEQSIQHGRSGHRVYDCHGEARGRLIEEARAERERGKFVEQVLGLSHGFAHRVLKTKFFLEGAAVVDAKYSICRTDGTPHVISEAFPAQAFDLLCQVDPAIDNSLTLSPRSVGGLRNLARRLEQIQPGLYAYLRDMPYGREHYRQCLVDIQELAGDLPRYDSMSNYRQRQDGSSIPRPASRRQPRTPDEARDR
ncbi:hypothetical protein [Micromonospora sp. NPDC000668]|uniref:hypothetical protein n=1 Tax=Micromonospora sp. NPDC000668 TaxID=3364219 RepID=UPI00369F321F